MVFYNLLKDVSTKSHPNLQPELLPFSKGSLHAAPRHGPALAPHAVRVAAERRRQAPADPKRSRNRRSSRFEAQKEVVFVTFFFNKD